MPAQDHAVRCVIPDVSPLDPWFVNWSLWAGWRKSRAGEACEYMLRLAFVYLAGAAPFIGSSGDLSGDLVNGKHAAYRSANAASASWRF